MTKFTPINRRHFLKGMSATSAALLASGAFTPQIALAKTKSDNILIWIILRGAWDGLNVLVPYGDPNYYKHRSSLAIAADKLHKADGLFGFNPALKELHQLYQKKELMFAHAVASPYRSRSHFDGQKILENGTGKAGIRSGWLNRLIDADKHHKAIAIDSGLPLILQGDAIADSWYPNKLNEQERETELLIEMLANNPSLSANLEQALKIEQMAMDMNLSGNKKQGKNITNITKQTASFLKDNGVNSPNIAALELGGWDTHASQGVLKGRLAAQLNILEKAILSFKKHLGTKWHKTIIIGCSEFGRTAKQNGTGGTDHGTGSALLLAGGAINGGQIIADWPELKQSSLYEGRDLYPPMDVRSVFKSILLEHLHITEAAVADIFPNSQNIKPHDGIVKS
ncbi:MAG: DUF1501 domain-containing protein [Rhizobiales bacterium]|nr:DUF1501 domain-containing protein [Hyphomicrobiales bacterium]